MVWFGRILCLGRKNLGCIRFAFQEGSWPEQAGQDRSGWRPGLRSAPPAVLCCVYWDLGQEMRIQLEMGIGNET